MGTVIRDVTLETLADQVRRTGIQPGQRFTVIVQEPGSVLEDSTSGRPAAPSLFDIMQRIARVPVDFDRPRCESPVRDVEP